LVVQSVSVPEQAEEAGDRHQRADARRNRAQILQAAETLFAEQGIGVPIDEIARRAGVGVGTVYRHFPTKEILAASVIVTQMEQMLAEAETLVDSEDPAEAFFTFLRSLGAEALAKRDLIDGLSGAGIDFKEFASDVRPRFEKVSETLLQRAQASGQVRQDVEIADLFGLVIGTCEMANKESRCSQARMLSVVIDGLRA
jgi:AcrR family transcriptional regulator